MARKNNAKKYVLSALVILAVILLVTLPFLLDASRRETKSEASILSGTVERGSITTTVSGTGTLSDGESIEIELPDGVRLREYLVHNGDSVKEGDALALVDTVTVMEAISAVKETLTHIESEMTAVATENGAAYVQSAVRGSVKAVYAGVGDDVREVMLAHGALALISLDDLMAVDIDCEAALHTGDAVTVVFQNGSRQSGTVSAAADGKITVTLPDEGYTLRESVTVTAGDGTSLGSGELRLNRSWKATAFTGTVRSVYAGEGGAVSAGTTLFQLSDTAYNGEYELLAKEHREYEELAARLFRMYEDGFLAAPADGMVWGIDENAVELLALERENEGPVVKLLSLMTPQKSSAPVAKLLSNVVTPDPLPEESPAPEETPAPEESPAPSEPPAEEESLGVFYYGTVTGEDTADIEKDGKTESVTFKNTLGLAVGDKAWFLYKDGEYSSYQKVTEETGEKPASPGGGGMPSGGFGGSVQQEVFEPYPLEGTVLMTVTLMDKMTVQFTVDELDVLSLSRGQSAALTIDALPGQSFEGTVTDIALAGSNRKYTVELSLDRTEKMLAGYNVSILIPVETRDNVPVIPAEAQFEDGGHTYLYTAIDEKTGTLTEPVEIVTGCSDGAYVEVLSGIEEGMTFWYEYYDKPPVVFPFS